MNLVKKSQTNKFAACQSTTIFEYLMKDPEISGAVAKINGRYPETGFSLNEKSKELVYVIEGNGRIIQTNKEITIQIGDVILLNHNEKFAWEGNMKIFMVTVPKFDPQQHKIIK